MDSLAEVVSIDSGPSLDSVLTTPDLGNGCCGNNSQSQVISGNPAVGNLTENMSTTSSGDVQAMPLQWGMLGLTLIIMCTAVGNLLVCLAVCWEKRLQNMTNYFLMSLAIADFLVSLLVMPLGMVVEIFGHFPMNPEICILWVASDVLMCSASIWHMCTMSMDRYFTLKYPMRYGRNKTRRMVAGKILFVWVVSVAISSPVCIHGFIDTSSVFRNGECVPTVKNFVIYGSIFAFYIPLLIMIVTYVLTIRILWKNQQRMKHIDRSDLKPRLAQLTAQCTGFAIPKLLTSLRKSRKPPSSHVSSSRTKTEKISLSPGLASALNNNNNNTNGNVNAVVNEADLGEGGEESRRSHMGMTYLSPPSPQTFTSRSPSPASTPFPLNSDTEESESEPNYFTLLQATHSSHSLYSPVSHATSDKSLHKRLQKKQLYQQQQQELQLLRQEYHQQRNSSPRVIDDSVPSRQPPHEVKPLYPQLDSTDCSTSAQTSPTPPPSPLFDREPLQQQQQQQQQPPLLSGAAPVSSFPTTSLRLSRNSSVKDVTPGKKPSKMKRYSKRCKKRRNSLTQHALQADHLKVPSPGYFKRGRSCKQPAGHSVLISAVSDTLVSHAGRGVTVGGDHMHDMSSFHLSDSNLTKDYKSLEWDRRYFQIQEEMDRCLQGEFGRSEKGQPRLEKNSEVQPDNAGYKDSQKEPDKKTLLKPEVSLPLYLREPLCAHSGDALNGYSHSAPNSPLNRRSTDQMKFNSSSDDEREDFVDDEDASDKNGDEDNDTSGSSNSDVITIRLHPPSPKVKCSNLGKSHISTSSGSAINSTAKNNAQHGSPNNSVSNSCPTVQYFLKTEHVNDLANFNYNKNKTISRTNATTNAASLQSLSPGGSPLPEVVISSEGEITLEETDDTLDDSPKHQRIKLRRPRKLQSNKYKFGKRQQSTRGSDANGLNNAKYKRPSFRNTFRIHRGKGPVKHILSKKTASNEKKASKVLGIIFLVFVVLWTPFFAVNVLNATCASCMKDVTKEMMSLFLWMGYIASLANPIIYTMFNTAFRRTFVKILTCKIQRTCRTKGSDAHYMSYTTMLVSERRNTVTVVLRDESK